MSQLPLRRWVSKFVFGASSTVVTIQARKKQKGTWTLVGRLRLAKGLKLATAGQPLQHLLRALAAFFEAPGTQARVC